MSAHQRPAGTRQWKRRLSSLGPAAADLDLERLAAVRAGRLEPPVHAECRADPERVPRAVPVPRAAVRLDAERRRDGGERVRHPQALAVGVQHDRVLVVEPSPACPCLVHRHRAALGDLGERRRTAELDEERVRQVPQREVGGIHVTLR
jgi:hypothetical protein